MKVITSEKIPVKMWLDDIEDGALEQTKNLANLPFAFKHIAIMPDSHQGYGMPIGGVLATQGVIIPNAVGVDIGCGMCAVKTSLEEISQDTLKEIMGKIREVVPVGFAHQSKPQDRDLMPLPMHGDNNWSTALPIVFKEFTNAQSQIGTLGGGNHFIEIQKGSDGHIWIMIHSGSRNLGKQVADHYNKIAVELNEKYYSSVPKSWELAFLPFDSEEGRAYMREMKYCVEFALTNRKLMMDRILNVVSEELSMEWDPMINIAHNYVAMENHFGRNVLVHRKGATKATQGLIGLIPGSMGSPSYVVEGLGNPDSFMSCSHGAGRKMGRGVATKTLSLEEEQKKMEGIVHGLRDIKNLDEAPGAYKDIDVVMDNQKELTKILVQLKPLANIKG